MHNATPVPATTTTLTRYIAHLAARLAANSIPKYLTAVRLLHLEGGLSNPVGDNWIINTLLKGIKRDKGTAITKKLPMTPAILLRMRNLLNLNHPPDIVFWAVCLMLFFGLFRKSNVLTKKGCFSPSLHLTRGDIRLHQAGIVVTIRWSKTIQFREKSLTVPMPMQTTHPLCPSTAILRALAHTLGADPLGPAFMTRAPDNSMTPLLPEMFVHKLKLHRAALGLDSSAYSGHSFRRGGATWALTCGLPGETIQLMGDWTSDCYKRYLDIPLAVKQNHAQQLLI